MVYHSSWLRRSRAWVPRAVTLQRHVFTFIRRECSVSSSNGIRRIATTSCRLVYFFISIFADDTFFQHAFIYISRSSKRYNLNYIFSLCVYPITYPSNLFVNSFYFSLLLFYCFKLISSLASNKSANKTYQFPHDILPNQGAKHYWHYWVF